MGLKISKVFVLAANQSVTNSIALVPIPPLSVLVAAFSRTRIKATLPFTSSLPGGFQVSITTPAGLISQIQNFFMYENGALQQVSQSQTNSNSFGSSANFSTSFFVTIDSFIENGPNAGFITINFSQFQADAGPTTLLRGATMETDIYTNF